MQHYPLWLPGSGFKVKTNEIKDLVTRLRNIPYNDVKAKMVRTYVVFDMLRELKTVSGSGYRSTLVCFWYTGATPPQGRY